MQVDKRVGGGGGARQGIPYTQKLRNIRAIRARVDGATAAAMTRPSGSVRGHCQQQQFTQLPAARGSVWVGDNRESA
jgi:hypothetical protein